MKAHAAAAALWLAAACSRSTETTGASAAPSASAEVKVGAGAKAAEAPPPVRRDDAGVETPPDAPRLATKTCRAITVKGTVTDGDGNALSEQTPLDGTVWMNLADKATVSVKHAVTGREVAFTGPALVLPCKKGQEWFVVVRGRVTTTTWAGASPGAEVLLATPFALVRYGDATLDVKVEDARLVVKAVRGDAWLESGREAGSSDRKVAAGTQDDRRGAPEPPKVLLGECERAAKAAETAAREVLGKSAVPLGERAAAHVRARRAAIAACAVADAALGLVPAGPERDGLASAVKKAEGRYRTLPSLTQRGD